MKDGQKEIKVSLEFTPGYEQRFTSGVLKIYGNRVRNERKKEKRQQAAG